MISKKNLTVIIVSFFSDEVIFDCISSIDKEIEIIVIENSRNFKLKNELEKKFKNVRCFIYENKGMGAGNNFGISKINSDFAFILNPDVILEKDTIHKIIEQSKKIESFSILAPIHANIKYPNYKIRSQNLEKESFDLINVDSVDGFSMLLNLNRISKILNINNSKFFDENFFMYLENDDLCKRLRDKNENIFVIKSSKINHLGAKGVNSNFKDEVELSRNWHWCWSKFYFKKKHFGILNALMHESLSAFISSIKFFIYLLIFNNFKRKIYLNRVKGFLNSLFLKPSSYRPKIKINDQENQLN